MLFPFEANILQVAIFSNLHFSLSSLVLDELDCTFWFSVDQPFGLQRCQRENKNLLPAARDWKLSADFKTVWSCSHQHSNGIIKAIFIYFFLYYSFSLKNKSLLKKNSFCCFSLSTGNCKPLCNPPSPPLLHLLHVVPRANKHNTTASSWNNWKRSFWYF